jgi:hypothetical protein
MTTLVDMKFVVYMHIFPSRAQRANNVTVLAYLEQRSFLPEKRNVVISFFTSCHTPPTAIPSMEHLFIALSYDIFCPLWSYKKETTQ